MKITNEMVAYSYEVAKQVYADELTRSEGKEKISNKTGMKIGSANDYITVFLDMMSGKEYHRTINNFATEYYFENIHRDFGRNYLKNAIEAADLHTNYYQKHGKGRLRGIEKIIIKFRNQFQFQ